MARNGKFLTIYNHDTGASYTLSLAQDGVISKWVRRKCQDKLGTPPGYEGAGPLGEVGEQRPPETPGWGYTFAELPDGGVKATPHPVAVEAAK